MIGIIDYGAGNLHSVKKAFDFLKLPARFVQSPDDLKGITRMLLPGVGHFQSAVMRLHEGGLFDPIRCWLAADRPFLGICLGMQLLFESSEEGNRDIRGFSLFPGKVIRFHGRKTLHMGWNRVTLRRPLPLFYGLENHQYYYFVHRYFAVPGNRESTAAESDFGQTFAAVVTKGHVCGLQFHPEKSGTAGLRLLENWGNLW